MPHEKIISGDLDGDGVEGHRKKITGGEFPRGDKEEHEFGISGEKKDPIDSGREKSKMKDSADPFYTGFGSSKPRSGTSPKKNSVIGGDSDIFDTGFGSTTQKKREKIVQAGASAGEKRHEVRQTPKKADGTSSFAGDELDDLFESPEPSFAGEPEPEKGKKKGSRMDKDPFYTGFGYTDQRGKNSPADGGLFPEGDTIPEMPEKELLPPKSRMEEPAEEEQEPETIRPATEKEPESEERPRKSSVLTRNDDDLFS